MTGHGLEPDARRLFEQARVDADTMLRGDGDPESFAVWLLALVRRQVDRYLRYAVLDGAMAAMDDDEIRRG